MVGFALPDEYLSLATFSIQMKNKALSPLPLPKRLSLVAQTVATLCKGIEDGHWHGHLPGERALCEHLQVSRRTLKSALDELKRKGWLKASERYRRRIVRRQPAASQAGRRKTIAFLLPGSYLALPARISFVMDSLRIKLMAADFIVQFHIAPALFTGSPQKALAQFIVDHQASVWIILSAHEPMQRWFNRQKLNCIILGSSAPGIDLPSVDVDFHANCHHAGAMLWRKGHRIIAIVLHKGMYGGDIASEEGLRDALKQMREARVEVIRHDSTPGHLCNLIDAALALRNPPTAFLVGGAIHAVTVATHLMRKGKRIPKDIAVVSRDDDPVLEALSPAIARYAVEPAKFASRITFMVRQLAETGTVSIPSVRMMPAYLPGESV